MVDHPKFHQTQDGTLLLNFGEYGQEVEVAAISGDGQRTLTVRDVGTAEVWDLKSNTRVGVLQPTSPLEGSKDVAPDDSPFQVFIESAALNGDGSLALLGLNDGTAGVFRVSDSARLSVLHPPDEQPSTQWGVIRSVAYSHDGTLALVGFKGRSVGVWSADGRRAVAFLRPPQQARVAGRPVVRGTLVSSVAASSDNRFVFAGGVDMTACIWDLDTGETVFEALEHAEDTLTVFDEGARFGWATTGGSVWLAREDAVPRKALATGERWTEVVIRGDELLARGQDSHVRHWTLDGTGTALFAPETPPEDVWSSEAVTLAFEGPYLLHPEGCRRLAIRSGSRRAIIEREKPLVTLRCVPGRGVLALSGWTDEVELWSIPDGRSLRTLPAAGGVGAFTLSKDGRFLAIGELGHGGGLYTRHVLVYAVDTGKLLHRFSEHPWQVSALDFSPEGRRLASMGKEVIVWRLGLFRTRLESRIPMRSHISDLRFLPDGRLLVLDEGRARVFQGAVEVQSLQVPFGYRTPWCIDPTGHILSLGLRQQGLMRIELDTGMRRTVLAPMPRHERFPSPEFATAENLRNGCALWRTAQGVFTHQSDGPRGWVRPIHLSADGQVVLPAGEGARVVDVSGEPRVVAIVPFEGKTIRASRVVDGAVVLINEEGRVFQARLPGRPSH